MNKGKTGTPNKYKSPPLAATKLSVYLPWILLAVVLLLHAVIRLRLLHVPFERDEGEFAYMGQLMMRGEPLYSSAYNMKLPGIYAAYALTMAIFGPSITGVHIGLLIVNAAATAMVFLLARRLVDGTAAVAAAAAYAMLTVNTRVLGNAAHAMQFAALFSAAGMLLLVKSTDTRSRKMLAAAGFVTGIAFTMKQPALAFSVFGAIYAGWSVLREKRGEWGMAARAAAVFGAAAALPFGLCCVYEAATDSFDKFWYWTVIFPKNHGSLTLSAATDELKNTLAQIVPSAAIFWILAGIGLTALAWDRRAKQRWVFLIGFLVASAAATSSSLYFRNHYFIIFFPVLAVIAGAAVSGLARTLARIAAPLALIPMLIAAAGVWQSIASDIDILRLPSGEICRRIYGENPFNEAVYVSDYIRGRCSPGDKVAVLGSEAQIYFYTGLPAATRYIYVYSMMLPIDGAIDMQREMIDQIETSKPRFIVLVNVQTSWMAKQESDMYIIRWSESYLQKNYNIVGILDAGAQKQAWGDDVPLFEPESPYLIYLMERMK